MVISRSITRNLRSTVFSLHRQELMAVTTLLPVYKQWGENVGGGAQTVSLPISFEVAFTAVVSSDSSWCNASCHITTTTITTMNYQSNRPDIAQLGPVQWLAIGI